MVLREVSDLFWTPEAFALLDAKTAGFERQDRRKWLSKSVDASGIRSLRGKAFTFVA